ncbi:MAG: DUF4468 domain-containing protein [Bacteroidales bacterium]|nr:DUF4468 domain-containing protein [Bacteroidales bacterium]
MRIFILFAALILGIKLHGQSDSIEKAMLHEKFLSHDISLDQYKLIGKKWNEAINKNKYPDLPLNYNGKLQYSYILDYPDINKQMLFSRILEWLSITYGIIPAYLYSNLEDGKIICSNNTYISTGTTGLFTYVFTIKDNKVLMDFINILYQVGSYEGETWIPDKHKYNIDQVFPIILKDSSKWDYYFKILNKIDSTFKNDINNLNDYILNYDLRYNF